MDKTKEIQAIARILSIEDIDQTDDVKYVEVPFGNGVVRFGSLSIGDTMEFVDANEDTAAKKIAGIRLILSSLVDAVGTRIGISADGKPNVAMIPMLQKKSAAAINGWANAILKLNGLDEESQKAAKKG